MGQKCKNYVPVGRRGIYQGVILNMHLHWKKHQTLQVIVKTFTPEEVKEIAAGLARLSGGIVLDIQEGNTIIMYRGKNYAQPPPEIMSPKVSLSRKKALDKSKYRDRLRALRRYIPRLEQELEDLHGQMKLVGEHKGRSVGKDVLISDSANSMSRRKESSTLVRNKSVSDLLLPESTEGSERLEDESSEVEDDSASESMSFSESEDLSDIFETESEEQEEDKKELPLYLDRLDKFPSECNDDEPDDFEEHLRKIASLSDKTGSPSKELKVSELDEIDKIFLRASSLLKKR
uniref:CRM domain-containing protein n=1 Tax=Arundo donax TaxID=35708 RepID=A0A0A9FFQ6_ARUDO